MSCVYRLTGHCCSMVGGVKVSSTAGMFWTTTNVTMCAAKSQQIWTPTLRRETAACLWRIWKRGKSLGQSDLIYAHAGVDGGLHTALSHLSNMYFLLHVFIIFDLKRCLVFNLVWSMKTRHFVDVFCWLVFGYISERNNQDPTNFAHNFLYKLMFIYFYNVWNVVL